MNTPNKLTIARVIMIPFFVAFLMYDITGSADKWIALGIFVVASLTDTLDGYLARKHNLEMCIRDRDYRMDIRIVQRKF